MNKFYFVVAVLIVVERINLTLNAFRHMGGMPSQLLEDERRLLTDDEYCTEWIGKFNEWYRVR